MSVTSKTATAVIALMIAAGAYPIAAQTQTESEGVEVEVIQSDQGAATAGETVEEGATEAGQAIGQAAEETGEALEQGGEAVVEGAESAGETVVEGAEAAGETVVEGAEAAGEAVEQGAETAGETVEQSVSETGQAAEQATGTTVEVIEEDAEETAGAAGEAGATAGAVETIEADVDEEAATGDLDEAQQQELEQAAAEGKPVPRPEMIMGVQTDGQWLSSDLIDREVRNPEGEVIGDIGAILFSDQGPDGIIVEVGGFLGIGEKDVAIKWNELSITDEGIVVQATEEQLKNAPEFVSMEEQQMQAQVEAEQNMTEDQGMMTSEPAGMAGQPVEGEAEVEVEAQPETETTQ